MEFKELTKKDAQISLAMELDKLMMTLPEGQKQVVEQDLDGFKRLFGKFINSTGPSVHWDKIEKLPEDAVSFLHTLKVDLIFCCIRFIPTQTCRIRMTRSPFAKCLTSWWSSNLMVVLGLQWDAGMTSVLPAIIK